MKHFTLQELTYSATSRKMNLDNAPTEEHRRNLEEMIDRLIDPLREAWAVLCANEHWGTPALTVSSGYRGYRLNKAVGGSVTSAHCVGWAVDLVPNNGRLREFKSFCREWLRGKRFDQMISENEDAAGAPRWVHIGYKHQDGRQRKQLLSKPAGETIYIPMTR